MAGEWTISELADLTINFDGKRKPVKESDRRAGPYPYYGASGVVDHVDGFLFDGDYLLIAEDGENLRTRQTPIAFMAKGRFWVNNHAHIVTGNDKADTRFLMYALQNADISGYLTGAVMPKLTQGNLNRIEISHPCVTEQRAIAHILGTLDDKIELNRRRNQTLEAMARALFKDWFVDFGPVRAKMEGREPYLPADLWQLFPDRLDDEGKPEGWQTKRISDYLSLAYGKSLPAGKRHQGDVPVYGSGGITGLHNEALVNGPVVIVGRKGTVGSLYWEDRLCFPIDTVFYVQPEAPLPFCYYLLESLPLRDMNTDAAVPGLNRENVYRLEIAAPPDELISAFAETAARFRESIAAVSREGETLAQLRDTLLPKLISGELRIADAEKFIERTEHQAASQTGSVS